MLLVIIASIELGTFLVGMNQNMGFEWFPSFYYAHVHITKNQKIQKYELQVKLYTASTMH